MKTILINIALFLLPGGMVFVAAWNLYKYYKKKTPQSILVPVKINGLTGHYQRKLARQRLRDTV